MVLKKKKKNKEKLKCACWWRQQLDFEAWEITKLLASSCQSVEGSLLSAPMHMRVAAVGCRLSVVVYGTRSTAKTFALLRRCCCEDDVPEWIDKGFVINEKQVAYESKKRKEKQKGRKYVRRTTTEPALTNWRTAAPLSHWRSGVVILSSTTTGLTSSSATMLLALMYTHLCSPAPQSLSPSVLCPACPT